MRINFPIILLIVFCASCTSRTIYKKPENLIPKEEMVALWTDIYIAYGAKNVKNSKLLNKINYMPFITKKYNIDSARFMESNIYYTSRIEDYEKMFFEVEKLLKSIRDEYDPLSAGIDPELPIYVKDSIRRSRKFKKEKISDTLNINARERLRQLQKEDEED